MSLNCPELQNTFSLRSRFLSLQIHHVISDIESVSSAVVFGAVFAASAVSWAVEAASSVVGTSVETVEGTFVGMS